jgi:outer membrane lipoprotein LolB
VTRALRASWLLLAFALSAVGCASVGTPPLPPGDPLGLGGRLSVQVAPWQAQPSRSLSAAFELRGTGEQGALDLATPLGSVLAQAGWMPGQAWIVTPQGRRDFSDTDALARELLGEAVPVVAMFDWLRGRPWPGAPSRGVAGGGFEQLGWTVDLSRFAEAQVAARRETPPTVTVRVVLDRP